MRYLALVISVWALGCAGLGCRKDNPPPIEICILKPTGGAACVAKDGSTSFKLPSELGNYWATNQPDMALFSSWCYKTNAVETMNEALEQLRRSITK